VDPAVPLLASAEPPLKPMRDLLRSVPWLPADRQALDAVRSKLTERAP
jgi:hypothetical protein